MSEEKRPSEPGTVFTHLPLPYIVHARVVVSEDAPAETTTVSVMAYSMFEAIFQVTQQLGGQPGLDDARVKIDKVEPDLPAYQRLFHGYVAAAVIGARR